MKSDYVMWIGINNVGDSKDPPRFFNGNYIESISDLTKWLAPRAIATRIDIVFARSEEEARNALRIRQRNNSQVDVAKDLFDNLRTMMENAPEVDLTDDNA